MLFVLCPHKPDKVFSHVFYITQLLLHEFSLLKMDTYFNLIIKKNKDETCRHDNFVTGLSLQVKLISRSEIDVQNSLARTKYEEHAFCHEYTMLQFYLIWK